jgi:hypothetical protein
MDIHFICSVATAFIIGFGIGFGLKGIKDKRWTSASTITESGYLAMSMVSRRALQKLDLGDSVGVKQDLCDAVANFYHSFKSSNTQTLASERSQIEALSQSSAVLAASLKKREVSDEKTVA